MLPNQRPASPQLIPAVTNPSSEEPPAKTGFTSLGANYKAPSLEEIQALLPNLEILDYIGHGGMGTYYKARQPRLARLVAIKILLVDPGSDASLIEGFTREARAMAGLTHPHIIGIYDFSPIGSTLYIIMEHVEGETLEWLIESRGFGLQEVITILTQVCNALDYAHEQGVIHRDLRLGNTMLDNAGQVKVGDFGLARLIGEELFRHNLTEANEAMGTMDYVAPEQHEPGITVDLRADIYSIGLMLYKLTTRTLPRGAFVPPSHFVPDLDPRVDEIVIRCMQRDPNNRYQTIAEVLTELNRLRPQADSSQRKIRFS